MEAPNMNSGSQTPPPAPAPGASAKAAPLPPRTFITIGVVVVLVAALLLAFFHPAIRSWISSMFGVSLETRTVLVEGESETGATFYALKGNAFEAVALPAGLTAYSERAGIRAGLKGSNEIVSVTGNETATLYTDGEFKDAVAISPDGTSIAFASMTPGVSETGVAQWYVKTLNLSDKRLTIVGVGYAPQYFLRDGKTFLLYTSPEGISVLDIAAGTTSTTPITVSETDTQGVVVSDDGSYLAIRDALIGQWFVYKVGSVGEKISFSSLRALPTEVSAVMFGHGKLYAAIKAEAGQELLVYATPDAGEPAERHALPESLSAYKLLP